MPTSFASCASPPCSRSIKAASASSASGSGSDSGAVIEVGLQQKLRRDLIARVFLLACRHPALAHQAGCSMRAVAFVDQNDRQAKTPLESPRKSPGQRGHGVRGSIRVQWQTDDEL